LDRFYKWVEKMKKIISLILVFGMLTMILNACTQSKETMQKTAEPNPSPQKVQKEEQQTNPAPQASANVSKETAKDPIQEASDTSALDQSIEDLDIIE